MINWGTLLLLSFGYVLLLFAIAHWGDRVTPQRFPPLMRSVVYSLTLAVYCTSWTFYGAVGSAVGNGWAFLPIYLGPMLVILFAWPMINRIITISKRQNLTSIADFIAARYGRARSLAVLVTLIATIGSVPYIALQLKAIVASFGTISDYPATGFAGVNTALLFAAALAGFAILFGTRKIDVTEHHDGMMLAIAFESIVKLLAFVAIGVFALLLLASPDVAGRTTVRAAEVFSIQSLPDTFVTQLILASAAIFCLPRQFHVAVVEAREDTDIRSARWAFPLYLLVFSVFVIPITLAGLELLPDGRFAGDTFVFALPMQEGQDWLTAFAFLGGFSAATGMVIVACVALSTMISNEIVVPLLLRIKALSLSERGDYTRLLIYVRRGAIAGIAALAYGYYLATDESAALASIGLLSFAAAAQFAPLILFGLYWPRATRAGAIAGLVTGFVLWTYTLFLPTLARAGAFPTGFVDDGLFSIGWLKPEALLFDLQSNALTHGVAWSLAANVVVLVVGSLLSRQTLAETLQARAFATPGGAGRTSAAVTRGSDITTADLRALAGRFLGEANTARTFADFTATEAIEPDPTGVADGRLIQFTERLLAGAIGTASARVVMTTALRRTGMEIGDVVTLLDETSQAIRFNRRLLEATLENISQGVSVVDASQRLIGWNNRYLELMDYPGGMVHVGKPVAELIQYSAERGRFGTENADQEVAKRMRHLKNGTPYRYQSTSIDGRVIEIRGQPMPEGGYVTTFTDITEFKAAEQALVEAKAMLEQRVEDRTAELRQTMLALSNAKAEADAANVSKTRFLAAAAHDLLQPLNAAKLFTALLTEHGDEMPERQRELVARVESGLVAVEDLLSALLDISRLDTAAPVPKPEVIPVASLFAALEAQFQPAFADKGLELRFARTKLCVRSDPALLRRILQNLISNARRYTQHGGVLVGCRRRLGAVAIQVLDTGVGIAAADQETIFEEFRRLPDSNGQNRRGLGLGLAIVRRIAGLLDHPLHMRSVPGRGSRFEIVVPHARSTRAAQPAAEPAEARRGSSLDGQPVLCIDNEQDIVDGMHGLLAKWGAQPMGATAAADALRAVDACRTATGRLPALLLVDYHLDGGVTGIEVIDAIRARARAAMPEGRDDSLAYQDAIRARTRATIPAVIVTADHSDTVAAAVRDAGHAILHKPVKPAALRALLHRILSRRSVA